jgi:hypothetical protein
LTKSILIALLLALQPPFLTLNHLMSSQTGNLQDLAACSGHPSPFIIGSEVEPDSLSRQEFAQHSQLPPDMGLRFMTVPVSEDAQYVYLIPCCCAPRDPTVGHLHMFLSLPKRFVHAGTFPLNWDQSEALTPNPCLCYRAAGVTRPKSLADRLGPEPHITRQVYLVVLRKSC